MYLNVVLESITNMSLAEYLQEWTRANEGIWLRLAAGAPISTRV